MKKMSVLLLLALIGCLLPAFAAGEGDVLSPERMQTIASVHKMTDYADGLNLYTMDVCYEYDIDNLTPRGPFSNDDMAALILGEALPGVEVDITAPDFGCTAFTVKAADGRIYMGRNYDFKFDTSAMMCICHPKNGYASVCFSALSNLGFSDPFASQENLAACLAAPLTPLDGMNEKGLAIAVLTLNSEPTVQNTGKPVLCTPVLIRLVLDRAATTEEAIALIAQYDYFATAGRDYHYYITDASGNGVVVEWDCEKADRPMVVTPIRTITNYYGMYEYTFEPGQDKGDYGVGKARRDRAEAIFESAGDATDKQTAWDGCMAASSKPDPESIVSNTQWSVVYDLSDLTHEFVLHRHWEDLYAFDVLK